MPDYQEMYYIMARASEKAIRLLIEAQQRCEALAIEENEPMQVLTSDQLRTWRRFPGNTSFCNLGFSLQEGKK